MNDTHGGMSYGRAINICAKSLNDPNVSDEEKGLAIHRIMSMATINAVNKDTLMNMVRYLWPFCFEWEEEKNESKDLPGNE